MKLLAMHSLIQSTARRRAMLAAGLVAAATLLPACTARQMEGVASSYLIVDAMNGSSGNSDEFATLLESDVVTNGTVFADVARVDLRLALKDPGASANPAVPTSSNYITVNRYHVKFVRSDGRNVQGVDVPYEFDGAASVTVRETLASVSLFMTVVRAQAKLEAPLLALRSQGGQVAISTIAEVTLFGHDQAGREVSVKANLGVNFADYGG